jgi:hypothetical protein
MRRGFGFVLVVAAAAASASAAQLGIPFGVAPVIDGAFDAAEWSDAAKLELFTDAGAVHARVHLMHDGERVYIAFEYVENAGGELVIPEILVDPDNGKAATWQADDWWFHVSAQDCDAQGAYDDYSRSHCGITRAQWAGLPNFAPDPYSVPLPAIEIAIPFSMLPASAGPAFGLCLTVSAWPSETRGYWPADADIRSPATWGEAILVAGGG